jgi:AcrR family transcriptional regulator
MSKKNPKRLPSEIRRSKILGVAIELFSSNGMSFTPRDVADAAGVTQPLIFRHFKSKEELVDAIYFEHFEGIFDQSWLNQLQDRSKSLYHRLTDFYMNYTNVVFQQNWMRVYFWSAMADAEINKRYTKFVVEKIIEPIAVEVRAEVAGEVTPTDRESDLEFETVYTAHSGIIYFGMRKYIFQDALAIDRSQIVHECVASMLHGAPSVAINDITRNRNPAQTG